jgi:hypothetical protein
MHTRLGGLDAIPKVLHEDVGEGEGEGEGERERERERPLARTNFLEGIEYIYLCTEE